LFAEKKIKIKTLSFVPTMTFSFIPIFSGFQACHFNSRRGKILKHCRLGLPCVRHTVYKIEHFYSMVNPASQGKIYCMLYAHLRPQLCDLKRKKPIRVDGLFNLSDL